MTFILESVSREETNRISSDFPGPKQHDRGARGIPFSFREAAFPSCVLVLSLGWHAWLFVTGRWLLDGDECYMALQGLEILKGARPVFFYSQYYMGCIEAYVFALFHLLTGASTPLTVKLQAAVQMLFYLISSYFLIRRFFGSRIALYSLFLLAFPPNMLSLWYGKIRGYMPALLLGNCILYALFWLEEQDNTRPINTIFWVLGLFMGLAWWANPVSMYYCVLVLVLAILSRRLRRNIWHGVFDSSSALFFNGIILFVLMILVSRSIMDMRRLPILRMLYEYRVFVLGFLICLLLAALLVHHRQRGLNIKPALVCLGFILGNAPMLFVYWTKDFLNLKQSIGGWYNFWYNMTLTPVFVFPIISGLTNITMQIPPLIFPVIPVVFVIMIYICILYGAIRLAIKTEPTLSKVLIFFFIVLLVFWAQNSLAWHHVRYLLPLYLPLFILIAFFFRDLDRLVRGLGSIVLGLMLLIHLAGTARLPSVKLVLPQGFYPHEKAILSFCRNRNLKEVFIYIPEGDAMRLAYFSEGKIIFLHTQIYSNRIPLYEQRYKNLSHVTLILPRGIGPKYRPDQPPDESMDHFDIYYNVTKEKIEKLFYLLFYNPEIIPAP